MPTTPPSLLTAKDIAREFQVSIRTVRRWQRAGRLPNPVRIGGTLRWRVTDLAEMYSQSAKSSENTLSPVFHAAEMSTRQSVLLSPSE